MKTSYFLIRKVLLDDLELSKLKELKKAPVVPKILRRYQCIHMLHNGLSKKMAAELLDVNIDTITDWTRLYFNKGLLGLGELNYKGRRISVLNSIQDELSSNIKIEKINTITHLQNFINKKFGIQIGYSWLSRYCKINSIHLNKKSK